MAGAFSDALHAHAPPDGPMDPGAHACQQSEQDSGPARREGNVTLSISAEWHKSDRRYCDAYFAWVEAWPGSCLRLDHGINSAQK